MVQNRNKIIELFIGNISNSIVHEILERAVYDDILADKYRKELKTSFELAKKYREKINPLNKPLHFRDINYIKNKIINKVTAELTTRIRKGYKNIDLNLIEERVNKSLKELNIS